MDIDWLINECNDPYLIERLFSVERYAWLSLSPDMCGVISMDGQILDINTHWERTTGLTPDALTGNYLIEHIHFNDRERVLAQMQELATSDIGSTTFSFRFLGKESIEVLLNWNVIFSPDHNAYFCTVHDPARNKRAESLAFTDGLTGLQNRLAFEERLADTLHTAQKLDSQVAVMFIDLDGFKKVNDTLGHKAGDTLLVRAARRMNFVIGRHGTAYRLGGDEFIVVLPSVTDQSFVADIADKLVAKLHANYDIDNNVATTGASLGISLFPTDATTVDTLLEAADKAMYQVKHSGKNNYAFFADQ